MVLFNLEIEGSLVYEGC